MQTNTPTDNGSLTGTVTGKPLNRIDGRLKVTGAAKYAAEFDLADCAHAYLVQAEIGRGRIKSIDTKAAESLPGVLAVLTSANAPKMLLPDASGASGTKPGELFVPLQSDIIQYNGQVIALVVAETFEQARYAARMVKTTYEAQKPVAEIEQGKTYLPQKFFGMEDFQVKRGNAGSALASAPVHFEQHYSTPTEHHVPMELHATIAEWKGDALTLYDSTQAVIGSQVIVAQSLGIPKEKVRVVSPYVGGGFGSKGLVWSRPTLAAIAAQKVGRPVKLVLSRAQTFTQNGHRSRTLQKISLGATPDGKLTAIRHESTAHTSMIDEFIEPAALTAKLLYACPNVEIVHKGVRVNLGTPTPMRAPGESPHTFAFESALDELAYKLNLDPIAIRLVNHADAHPESGKPWSSKNLKECYRRGAEAFGWSKRSVKPRSMTTTVDGEEWLVGYGMATATYPGYRQNASAKCRVYPDGRAVASAATQDIGTGTYTIMTQVAAEALGMKPEMARFALGDSNLPPAPTSGGSTSAASVAPAVHAAAKAVKEKIMALARSDDRSPLHGAAPDGILVSDGRLALASDPARGETYADIVKRSGLEYVEAEIKAEVAVPAAMKQQAQGGAGDDKNHPASLNAVDPNRRPDGEQADADQDKFAFQSFGAQFVEVRVRPSSGEIRVVRVVNCFDVGTILNAKTARSQILGGVIMGIGMATHEHTLVDKRWARIMNADLGEYHVPVNADAPTFETIFLDIPDLHISPLGVRGVGEIGITGVAAAIANAVYNATGVRVRDLPITPDKLL